MKCLAIALSLGSILAVSPKLSFGQAAAVNTGGDATAEINAVTHAVWGGTPVHSVQFSGNATWQVGTQSEQATLSASADSSGNSSLQLSGAVNRLETETAIAPGRVCQWSGADNQLHAVEQMNCIMPIEWLLPPLTLQPNQIPVSAGFTDLGLGTFSVGSLHQVEAQIVDTSAPTRILNDSMRRSTMDLGIDPVTNLPAVLTYRVRPDSGAPLDIDIEIRYSDYRQVGNAQIPFHIQRYINGALELDLQFTSATLS